MYSKTTWLNWDGIAELFGYESELAMLQDFVKKGWSQYKMSWMISKTIYTKVGIIREIGQSTIYYRLRRQKQLGTVIDK